MFGRIISFIIGTSLFCGSALASVPSEDIQIIKDILKDDVASSDIYLDQAAGLSVQSYNKGTEVTQVRCEELETRISQNYPLHSYQSYGGSGGIKPGVKLCPVAQGDMKIFDGEWIFGKTVKFYQSEQSVTNLLGVKGATILTVDYRLSNRNVTVTRQYILDSNYKMLQFIETRQDKGVSFWSIVSALDAAGNVLSKTTKTWKNPNEAFYWKRLITFVPANADAASAARYYQNDGKGVEVELRSYLLPYQWKWDSYEVSPYTRNGGLYKVGNHVTNWPDAQAGLNLYSNGAASCAMGHIGWDKNGDYIRFFGNPNCSTEMDVNTTRF